MFLLTAFTVAFKNQQLILKPHEQLNTFSMESANRYAVFGSEQIRELIFMNMKKNFMKILR
jgi:hypothetical protein